MLRNYMNEGGKVVFSGRNGWVQQTSTGTGLQSYSGYTWWQEPVYGFDYPPNQAGDDDRPHTAFFRELDISNDWGQWWLGINGAPGRRGHDHLQRRAPVRASGTGFLAGMPAIALDTTAGAGDTLEPTQNAATGRGRAAGEGSDAAAPHLAVHVERDPARACVPRRAGRSRLQHGDEHAGRGDHLHARRGLDRVRARADRRPGRTRERARAVA